MFHHVYHDTSAKTSKHSSESSTKQHGSEFTITGNASVSARDGGAIDIIGSSLDVGEHLSLDADDVNILASANESRSDSSEQSRSAGFSVSTSGAEGASAAQQMAAASGSANVNMQNSDSDSSSKTYNNSSIKAGSFSSTSKNLHLAGANVEITGDIDIITDNLVVESLQNESRSSHSSEGGGFSASSGGGGTVSYNNTDGSSERAWTDNQTTLIGGGNVNINAKNTEVHGAVVANAVRNEDGSLTDLGNLNLITDELTVTDLQDTDVSESSGVNLSVSVSSGKDEKGEHQLSSNSTTVGLTNQGHRKEQTTAGTLGGGTITRRDGSEHELGDTNRDLDQRQVVTLDQQTGGLNATVTVDHRLLSEEGRNEIKKTFVDTSQHVQEIAQAADDLTSTDIDTLAALNKVDEYATNRKVIAEKAADEAEQNKLRGDEGAEGSQEGLQELSNALTDAHGLEQGAEVALYDGSQVNDDTVAIDKTAVNKSEVAGAYHERDQGIYVNVDKTDMTDSTATVTTLVHEQTRHQMAENGDTGRLSRDDQTTLAHAAGERAGDAWEAYSDLAGVSTKGGSTAAQWRETQRHSAAVQQGTQNMAAINNNELKARQLNANEASMMDQARAAIDNSGLSDAEKAAQKSRLDDLACAEVQCAAGVNSNDPRYGELVAKQERGEAIKQNDNTDIIDMMGDLGVETVAQEETTIKNSFLGTDRVVTSDEQQFEYDAGDEAQDFASKNTREFAERVNNAAEAAVNGVLVVAAPVVDGLDNQENGFGFTEHMAQQTRDNIDGALNHESDVGQRVLNSFSSETFEEAPNYVLDTGLAAAGMLFPAAKGVKKADDVAQDTFENLGKKSSQLDDSLIEVIRENADKSRSKKVEYDVDNETGFDSLANRRREAESNRELYQERMKDTSPETLDNRHVDNDLYENDRRTGDKPEEGAKNKESSRTITNFVRDVVKNVNEISELFE
ncbi:hemagglutinin repeat-containing protein [Bacterioplanes sanyensis]|uniref:hemagglutinin repeat-containing protein n=1 Tax=Bacterioplanes sanyensis TaxID=1249553 RepID=UPI0012FDD516|nr:hemagglutinin repeat-containing protein [Bacterioplanes sanyensis]